MTDKDYELIIGNLKDALEHQENLNQQILGRLDAYQTIVKVILNTLIDRATERR